MKRMISLFLVLTMVVGLLPIFAQAEGTETINNVTEAASRPQSVKTHPTPRATTIASGECGENVQWVLYEDGTLNIYGAGVMDDYDDYFYTPWYAHKKSIQKVVIEHGVKTIGDNSFAWHSNLSSVTISDSVTIIGVAAFYNCSKLTTVLLPDSITHIGEMAFRSCSKLTGLTIPNSVISIGSYAFDGCYNITSLILPDGITNIGSNAFSHCNKLTSVTIPGSVTSIPSSMFSECTSLSVVTISDGVTGIGGSAFSKCSVLSSVTIPDSVTKIGSFAFSDCGVLTKITLPDTIVSVGNNAFARCSNLQYNAYDKGKYLGNKNNPYLVLMGTTNTGITSIAIHPETKVIGGNALKDCSSLTNIAIPDGVKCIDSSAFASCSGLTSVIIPGSVFNIGGSAFASCTNLTSVTLPDGITGISQSVFSGCSKLIYNNYDKGKYLGNEKNPYVVLMGTTGITITDITIHPQTKVIVESAFYKHSHLANVLIPSSVTSIGRTAFSSCTSLVSVTIPNSVISIGEYVFSQCTSLTSVTIPGNITSIEGGVFSNCTNLTSVTIPTNVTRIGNYAFGFCNNLKDLYYIGTEDQWNAISIGEGNECLTSADLHCEHIPAEDISHSIAVLSTEKSLCVKTGREMWLAFGLMDMDTGMLVDKWKDMAVTVSDPTVISLSDYELTEYGYALNVTGKKQGFTNVTVTDTETGVYTVIEIGVYDAYIQSHSYAIDDMRVFYPGNKYEDHIATNIYNINGLYVNNYACTKSGDTYYVEFDVYNDKYYSGAVDIYDESGLWLGYEEIKKFKSSTSVWDTGEQFFYLVSNTIALIPGGNDSNLMTYEQESVSQLTHIKLEIKEGEYFTISNNVATSPGTFMINALEALFDGAYAILDVVTSDSVKNHAFEGFLSDMKKSMAQRLIEARNESLKNAVKKKAQEALMSSMQSKIEDITENFCQAEMKDQVSVMDDTYSQMAGLAENILEAYNIDWKPAAETAIGVTESLFTEFAGPAGLALKGCFAINKGSNQFLKGIGIAYSTDEPHATVFSKVEEGFINAQGVTVNTKGNVDAEAVLQVFRVSDSDTIETVLDSDNPLEQYEMYNICFVKDDQLVQPSGKVSVRIPVPVGVKSSTCKVYRQETDGSWTVLNAWVEGNYLVFETDHFSLYAVIGDAKSLSVHSLPNKQTYQPGASLDTTGLVLDLAGELISDGFLCDPMVVAGPGTQKITVTYGNASTEFTVEVREAGCEITGAVESREDGLCTVSLYSGSVQVAQMDSTDTYTFQNLTPGTYTLQVSKPNHVTRTYEITVSDGDVVQDVKLHLTGDINGDGRINVQDVARIYAWVKKTGALSDYEQLCAEVSGDGRINVRDVALVYGHVKKTSSLW